MKLSGRNRRSGRKCPDTYRYFFLTLPEPELDRELDEEREEEEELREDELPDLDPDLEIFEEGLREEVFPIDLLFPLEM